jgi:hypothetical protein
LGSLFGISAVNPGLRQAPAVKRTVLQTVKAL